MFRALFCSTCLLFITVLVNHGEILTWMNLQLCPRFMMRKKYVKHYITYHFVCNFAKEMGMRFSRERSLKDFEFCWFDYSLFLFYGVYALWECMRGQTVFSCCYV